MTDPATPEPTDPKEPAWYRDQMDVMKAENKALKDTMLSMAFSQAGIDTAKGLGKTMRDTYEGDADVAKILAHAKDRFEWAPPPTAPTEPIVDPATAAAHQNMMGGLGRLTGAPLQSALPNDVGDQIAAAEKAGNWTEAMRLKNTVLAQRMLRTAGTP